MRWKTIPGHRSFAVTDEGAVFHVNDDGMLGARKSTSRAIGHNYITVCLDGRPRLMHQLVAAAFCRKPRNVAGRLVIRHLNGNRHDNRAANLAWGTHGENIRDQWRHKDERIAELARMGFHLTRSQAKRVINFRRDARVPEGQYCTDSRGLRIAVRGAVIGIDRSGFAELLGACGSLPYSPERWRARWLGVRLVADEPPLFRENESETLAALTAALRIGLDALTPGGPCPCCVPT